MSEEVHVHSQLGKFAILPLWLIVHPDLKPSALRVFAYLAAEHADRDTATCYPSWRVMSAALKLSRHALWDALGQLKDVGALTIEQRRKPNGDLTTNLYTLVFIQPGESSGVVSISTLGVVSKTTLPSFRNQHYPSVENDTVYRTRIIEPESLNQNQEDRKEPPRFAEAKSTETAKPKTPPQRLRMAASTGTQPHGRKRLLQKILRDMMRRPGWMPWSDAKAAELDLQAYLDTLDIRYAKDFSTSDLHDAITEVAAATRYQSYAHA